MKSKKNKKSIGIIIAVVLVLLVGVIGGTGDSDNSAYSSTDDVHSFYDGTAYESDLTLNEPSVNDSNPYGGKEEKTNLSPDEKQTNKPEIEKTSQPQQNKGNYKVNLRSIPVFSGDAYVAVNNNIPGLSPEDRTSAYFEKYTALDYLDRCGVAFACLGKETMPTEERGAIGSVKPSGWHTVKYDFVDGRYLYNRCHLIGFQLSAENANTRNLITGTRYMNVQGMLPFENMVADYIKETNNHVLYRVTPIFKGTELVCRGVQIEAFSVEDNGDGICFNVYCYNNQPGVEIDYATGDSWLSEKIETTKKRRK